MHSFAHLVHGGVGYLASFAGSCLQNIPCQSGIVLVFFSPILHGIQHTHQCIRHPAFAFNAADSAVLQPSHTLTMVGWSLKILCKSPTGQMSGLPGSVRRTRAGSVTMVLSFCRTTGSGSVSRMVLPYDFDILRPSVPGSLAAGVSSGCGSGKT